MRWRAQLHSLVSNTVVEINMFVINQNFLTEEVRNLSATVPEHYDNYETQIVINHNSQCLPL